MDPPKQRQGKNAKKIERDPHHNRNHDRDTLKTAMQGQTSFGAIGLGPKL